MSPPFATETKHTRTKQGRLTKGWEAVCAANRFQEGHEISLKLWLAGGGEGGGEGAAAGGGNGGQRKQTAFVVVGREGQGGGGLLGGYGGRGGGDESSLGGGAGNAPSSWENDENDAATGAFQPHQHQQQQF